MAKLVSRLRVIADGLDDAMSLALHDTATFILMMIRFYAPVDTGWLRDSYQKESVSQLHILIGSMVNYSIHQEFGTVHQSGKPHFLPSFLEATPFFRSAVNRRIKELS